VRRYLFDDREASREEARGFFESSAGSWRERGYGWWTVRERGREELGGFVALQGGEGDPSLMYGLAPELWGRGYVTEAARAVLDHAFESLELPRVVADVDRPNTASVRVLEKLGMARTREAQVAGRPILYYALTREGWLRKPTGG
jgi:ribosomal-protein-alanine N-acetyltransferase